MKSVDPDRLGNVLELGLVEIGDRQIEAVAAQRPEPRQGAVLVRARDPAVADDDRRQQLTRR